MKAWLEARWYSQEPAPLLLRPLAALHGFAAAARRRALSAGAVKLGLPVIVVGNISVGGTGKTPFTPWLVERLREWGWKPGVISRGYGGRAPEYPLRVTAETDAALCGDEPALMARRLRCPVAVAPDRVAAAKLLMASGEVDILVADDGLQHYRLHRDLEICVVDSARGVGNGALLPAGPLREPPARLNEVDVVVMNGPASPAQSRKPALEMLLRPGAARSVQGERQQALQTFQGGRVHALAGIGNPERFFTQLEAQGLSIVRHAFADHHRYTAGDIDFGDGLPALMTEKDAVKCLRFAGPQHWYVPVDAQIGEAGAALVRKLAESWKTPAHG